LRAALRLWPVADRRSAVDVVPLHAKMGELTAGIDLFLERTPTKVGVLGEVAHQAEPFKKDVITIGAKRD
jgi:hypothetical protein